MESALHALCASSSQCVVSISGWTIDWTASQNIWGLHPPPVGNVAGWIKNITQLPLTHRTHSPHRNHNAHREGRYRGPPRGEGIRLLEHGQQSFHPWVYALDATGCASLSSPAIDEWICDWVCTTQMLNENWTASVVINMNILCVVTRWVQHKWMYVHTRNYSGHFLNATTESDQRYWIVEIFKIHATPHEMLFNLDPISLNTFIKYLFFKLFWRFNDILWLL